jgi:UPF0755 protein
MVAWPPSATSSLGPQAGLGRSRTLALLSLAGVLALAMAGWLMISPTAAIRDGPRVIEIPPYEGLIGAATRLRDAGVVRSPLGFALLAVLTGKARGVKAGEYEVPQNASALGVLALVTSGRVVQHPLVFREGHSVAELARQLEAERLASAEDILRTARDRVFLAGLGIEADSIEGYLFPDTYQFVRGMKAEDLLSRMVVRMRERLTPDLRAQMSGRELTVHEALTLASIIEREAVDPDEMGLISAVFWNRLRRDMPLQADPTVQYAVGKERQRLTREDLQVDSPYNTYRRLGLPPGPIGSPGLAAIRAVLSPAPVDFLYFVAVDERRHHFSTTLEDHNAAVARYRQSRGR